MAERLNTNEPSRINDPKVTVIVACRNEEAFLHKCLLSLVNQDYPQELTEIIVVDGMSTDQTWGVANYFVENYPNVKLDVNLKKFKYPGLNRAISKSSGDFIAIADAHSAYHEGYIRKSLEAFLYWNVHNVGGGRIFFPRSQGPMAMAITLAQVEPFGFARD